MEKFTMFFGILITTEAAIFFMRATLLIHERFITNKKMKDVDLKCAFCWRIIKSFLSLFSLQEASTSHPNCEIGPVPF